MDAVTGTNGRARVGWLTSLMAGALVSSGCGGGSGGGSGGGGRHDGGSASTSDVTSHMVQGASGNGTVTSQWTNFCAGKFKADTAIKNDFGDGTLFTAHAGETYLITDDVSPTRAQLVYLASAGPEPFQVDADTSGALPFTSTCASHTPVRYYAVFTDVNVFAEPGLKTKLCDLKQGTALPSVDGERGYSVAGDTLASDGPQTYEVSLNAFSAQCGNASSGYISVPQSTVLGTQTWLVPIITLYAAK
jgi:hypothetical protein